MGNTKITHAKLYFTIRGELTYYVNEEDPMFETTAWDGSVYTYEQLLDQLKEGDLKEAVKRTYDKFKNGLGKRLDWN